MREILFIRRGKRKDNGKWVYGNIVFTRSGRAFLLEGSFFSGESHEGDFKHGEIYGTEVIPETVGQYTGLTDKNCVRVFEGDILSAHFDESYPDDETLLLVGNNGYAFTLKEEDSDPEMIENSDMRFFDETFVVIGNVHDNPEIKIL